MQALVRGRFKGSSLVGFVVTVESYPCIDYFGACKETRLVTVAGATCVPKQDECVRCVAAARQPNIQREHSIIAYLYVVKSAVSAGSGPYSHPQSVATSPYSGHAPRSLGDEAS